MNIRLSGFGQFGSFDAQREGLGAHIALIAQGTPAPSEPASDFEEPPGISKPFRPHYEAEIRHRLEEFESHRVAALERYRNNLLIYIGIVAVLALGLVATFTGQSSLDFIPLKPFEAVILFWVLVFGGFIAARSPVRHYNSIVKADIYPAIFKYFGDDFRYEPVGPTTAESLERSGLIPSYDGEDPEDYVSGSHNGVRLELCENRLTKRQGSGRNRRTVTVFRGIFIRLAMNKRFSGNTVVRRDLGRVFNWMTGALDGLETVRLEDPVFEDKFEVGSTDQVEARYLLTPSFMERLLRLSEAFGDEALQCSFYDDSLLLMIPSRRNRFEASSIFVPATFHAEIATILREMAEIFGVIDALKLDQRTGL